VKVGVTLPTVGVTLPNVGVTLGVTLSASGGGSAVRGAVTWPA
jgi:hypothetical protein